MTVLSNDKLYYLIINQEGKYNYSNKGFQATPHYISLVTAKYRIKDIINMNARFFDPSCSYKITAVDEMRHMKVRAYKLNSESEMIREHAQPEQDLREFALANNMANEAKTYDALMNHLNKSTNT